MEEAVIRHFKKMDLNGVMNIESISFSDPWSITMFEALFEINPKGFYVIENDSKIIGFAVVLVEPCFAGILPHKRAHLINLAVHPDFHRNGIGTDLVERIERDMRSENAHSIYLEVRRSNKAALKFYSNLLFKRIGLIKGFYQNEDAIVMSKTILNQTKIFPKKQKRI